MNKPALHLRLARNSVKRRRQELEQFRRHEHSGIYYPDLARRFITRAKLCRCEADHAGAAVALAHAARCRREHMRLRCLESYIATRPPGG